MTQAELQAEYDRHKGTFDVIKQQTEDAIVKTETYKGEFYEISTFSYQRAGFRRGKPIENINHIRNMNGVVAYGFNDEKKIVEIKSGISLKDQFYYRFLFYEEGRIKSLDFDNVKTLRNISFYLWDESEDITIMYLKGRKGSREERYHYSENKVLEKIVIRQFDDAGIEGSTLLHSFEYDDGGKLKSITRSATNGDHSMVIFTNE